MFNESNNKQINSIGKSKINSWLCFLMDKYKGRGNCEDEEKLLIKRQFLVCADGKYSVTDENKFYIDQQIDLMYLQ